MESDIESYTGVTKHHKASVELYIALIALGAIQKRIGIDQATQDWTLGWQLEVGRDCGRAHDERQRLTNKHKLESALPRGAHWTGGWVIGSGTFAKAYLYVQHDQNGTTTNRVVAKDCDYNGHGAWDFACSWSKTPDGKSVPMEVKTMFDLRGRLGSEYVLKIINWRMSMKDRFYRIYTEYAPLGDLLDITSSCVNAKSTVPEPFVWHISECLTIVGLLLERGEMERNPLSDWKPIVHRDLKLDNVFLDQPSKTRFCRYPTPKVGDFGPAVYAPTDTPRVSEYYNTAGTPDNFPVEQHRTLSSRVVSSKSNVWGVGNIAGSLIWQTVGYDNLNFGSQPGGLSEPSFNDFQTRSYSEELRALILHCMRYDQDDRPDFPTLLRMIRKARRAGLDRGLGDEPFDGGRWTADSLLTGIKDIVRSTGIRASLNVD